MHEHLLFIILQVVLDKVVVSKELTDEKRVSKIPIKLGSLTTITFLYEQIFRINYQESNFKKSQTPSFCQLKQSNFIATDAQSFDIDDYCLTNCLLKVNDRNIFIVNEKSQFLLFAIQEQGNNQDFKIPYFSLKIRSKITIDDDLKPEKLAKSRLILNSNLPQQQAVLLTETKVHWFEGGKVSSTLFDFSKFEESYISKVVTYQYYVFISDDYTGIQIYKFNLEQGDLSTPSSYKAANMESYMSITISQFFGVQEWQYIQDQLNNAQTDGNSSSNNNSNNNNDDGSDDNSFEFNFSLKSIQIKELVQGNINVFTYEQYSKSICVFTLDLINKHVKLVEKIPTNGKVSQFILINNFLYAHQTQTKAIRDTFSLIEFQQQTTQVDYLARQTYPITSPITKIVASDTLIYSLQENIISIIRRQVPFKLSTEEESRQQISVQYSEGADDIWTFPVQFKQNQLALLRKRNQGNIQTSNDSDFIQNPSDNSDDDNSSSYFSPYITLQDNENLLQQVDAILVKKDNSLFIRIIQEHLPHLSCTPEDEKDLNDEYEVFVQIEVFDTKDSYGDIKLKTYTEGVAISVYRDIFENSTVALVVGLSIGLTLSLIVVIVFCIYFYRMKNHYQLLLQDTTKDLSRDVAVTSINTSSNNSSTESYSSSIPTSSNNQNIPDTPHTQVIQIAVPNHYNQSNPTNIIQVQQQFYQSNPENYVFADHQANNPEYYNNNNYNHHEFYLNERSNPQQNFNSIIPNNTFIKDSYNQEEFYPDINQKKNNSLNHPQNDSQNNNNFNRNSSSNNIDNNNNNENNSNINNQNNNNNSNQNNDNTSNDKNENKIQIMNNIIFNSEQIDEELNSNNSNKSEHISFQNSSMEEQESINNSQSDKSSKGPCAQTQSSKDMGLDLISLKSIGTDPIKQMQEQLVGNIFSSFPQGQNNTPNKNISNSCEPHQTN